MEIKKHIKIILNEDGTFTVGDGMGCPIAGECNAFFVELEYPAYYSGYNKSAYLSFNGSEEVYDLNNKDGFFLPSGINKGGVVSVTATAYKNVNDTKETIKWKPYHISVLDAPVITGEKLKDEENALGQLQQDVKDLNEKTIKKDLLDFIPNAFSEIYSGEERIIKFDGKVPSTGKVDNKQVKLGVVTNNKNGDMTPEMLNKLNSALSKMDFPYGILSSISFEANDQNANLQFRKVTFNKNEDEEGLIELPAATDDECGLMTAADKQKLDIAATLDENGKVPQSQLPSYVDDVLEFASTANFPSVGENGKIYVTLDTNKTYRWSGSSYVEISASLALGETSGTAYRGDRGKIAYDHSQVRGNPHNTSKSEVGLGNVANERQYSAQNMQPYPLGFASADNDFSWGVNIGSPLRVWNEASGGSIGFRKNCPANGKLSIVVDGKVYVDEGQKELATLDSPTFTGSPKVPTPSQSSNDNTVANTAWVKNILNEGGIALYRHRILLSGSNTSVSNAFTLGLIEVYTKSSQPITTVAGVAAALGITGNMELVPVSGCAENGSNHTVLCTEAWVSPSSITLHGMYFGYSSGNGIIERVSTTVTSVSDKVSLVQ